MGKNALKKEELPSFPSRVPLFQRKVFWREWRKSRKLNLKSKLIWRNFVSLTHIFQCVKLALFPFRCHPICVAKQMFVGAHTHTIYKLMGMNGTDESNNELAKTCCLVCIFFFSFLAHPSFRSDFVDFYEIALMIIYGDRA